ncbi:coproporphyrinogen III oxidase chloroplast precursor [Chlorella sorokiniana]|uniref:coproporphyrinogen oxidase n=1 Tax=Chlorella sorokiniana TaxID=3076 RepID=A0A2P6TYY3_CHLSO|nr:coproporphyrinogen III oxidase chloroplast precursor [Chlorella sorokiniana]|eukprot:PRW59269.1 coproporphyrinogen III oxidase chloroplast precursor [Chlorella sorokiniana]
MAALCQQVAFTQAKPNVFAARKGQRSARVAVKVQAALAAENYITEVPESLLRPGIDDPNSMRGRFEKMIRGIQSQVCSAIEEVDGNTFRQDAWTRPGGGGGITRVMQEGNVWEKAGVAVSVVYGTMPAEAYRVAVGKDIPFDREDRVPFFAAGISSVMHPWNPHCPTMHFNYRYFETEDWKGIPGQWWFGGGTDITPNYIVEEDMKHFHGVYKAVCDRHDPTWYEKMKHDCDDYFTITHRGETRGLGGIIYEDLNDRDKEKIFAFATDAANHIVESYVPIIKKHKNDPYSPRQKEWQQIRRGRYTEFNLVYDRGTIFGLKTGGRIESILMSLPLTASWRYDYQVDPQGPEQKFLDAVRNPHAVNWV